MTDSRPHLEPGPDHPITVQPYAGRVTVDVAGTRLADTTRALELREASYPPAFYVPVDDVDRALLQSSDQHTYCPYKGEASYYDITPAGADRLDGAVWYYPEPYPAVGAIEGHVAFYPDRVTITAQ